MNTLMLPKFHIVIPARYASQRFPKKMLADLLGKPLVQWVYELALKAGAETVTIATDHNDIYKAAQGFGADVLLTSNEHSNGTERLAEVAKLKAWKNDEIIVNLQGDEPLMPIELVHKAVYALIADKASEVATVSSPIYSSEDFLNPNVVKVVTNCEGRAIYFSSAPIPWERDKVLDDDATSEAIQAYKHVGLYVYRASLLARYSSMPHSPLEVLEKLEQLRFIDQDVKIQVASAEQAPPHGVDTKENLEEIRKFLENRA